MNSKFILDVCCGKRMMWFDKEHPNCIYNDTRLEINPNTTQDFRKLDFNDKSFKLVVFDPPHLIGGNFKGSNMQNDYGDLNKNTWRDDLTKGFNECWRVLEDNGILIFKWSDCNRWSNISNDCNVREILKLFHTKPLFGHKTRANKNMISSTYWFCFMKFAKAQSEEQK
jgi:tRNA G10  N-methylase Trm11